MPCFESDGSLSTSGKQTLKAIKEHPGTPEEIAPFSGLPLYRVRSGTRALAEAGLAEEKEGKYHLTPKGNTLLG
ncbi:hypothetical protein [Dehalococcoides mccartyi]|jgi:predicted transcriptional regulator|uniref:Uncharacterized protein n=2 Tax=Dehalococcoides TaxID=61434 RepID=A0A142VC02_9CHLR|nr:hypothetical protein [Dehalococcoides mccartyi]AII61569.1 hypothetical protein X794_07175 [Dehalococcoides mccartyi CG5]AMU87370.1 hypothetical protein Dm11a5_1544 [Dehalococcoides mccartyi]AOW00015.1 hypothetical protein DCWBC2_1407 [Dehalococcoides mccartyi]AQX75256.1 hypothetical protein B1776_06910 [Dehalococcoides mccartyi]AQY73831.1 hypothetical protein B1772_07220 [Dehalococcoides mccartyi]